jgi:hypothetical protein
MNTLDNVIALMTSEQKPFWRLVRVSYGNKIPQGQHVASKHQDIEPKMAESIERLTVLLDRLGRGNYEIDLLKKPTSHGNDVTAAFSFSHGQAVQTEGLGSFGVSGGFEEYRSQMDGLVNGLLGVEKERTNSLMGQMEAKIEILLAKKDLEREREKLEDQRKAISELEKKFNSDSEKFSSGLGMAFESILGRLGPVTAPLEMTPEMIMIDNLATSLAASGLDLERLRLVARIVNSYLHQPDAPIWNVFKAHATNA